LRVQDIIFFELCGLISNLPEKHSRPCAAPPLSPPSWERGRPARHAAQEAPGRGDKAGRGACSPAALPPEAGGTPALPGAGSATRKQLASRN